ncbi:MAG TPA: hypothetical protein VK815_03515 [Candidatus Acidoferrales bacterium]|jgi:hypothetical protein|nr:hypothetical protein [Candidatus Acidoferrales bacterium]
MKTTNPKTCQNPDLAAIAGGSPSWRGASIWTALALLILAALPAGAQNTIKPFQVRFEVPVGFSGTVFLTNNVMRVATNGAPVDGTGTNWVIPNVNVSITGAPAGVTAALVDSGLVNPIGTIPINLNTNNGSKTTNLVVQLVFSGSQAAGISTLGVNMVGGITNGFFPLVLEVAKIWNGPANATLNGAGNWSDASKWQGGIPGPGDVVVFNDIGTQTNNLLATSITTNLLSNSVVDVSTTIAALRFSQTNAIPASGAPNTNWQNLVISPGVVLTINGSGGFSMLRDFSYGLNKLNVTIAGTNGTLIQSNETANFSLLADGAVASILDMSALSKLQLDVNEVNIGDILSYPNYQYFVTNAYSPGGTFGGSRPSKCLPTWKMAATNIVRGVYVDPFNYTNALFRSYALEIGRNETTGGSSGNDFVMTLGATNSLQFDGICVGGYAALGSVINFLNSNSFALFRNTNGGRMSVFTCGDAAGYSTTAGLQNNTKCGNTGFGVDFTRSTVDVLVDRFYMSRDRGYTTGNGICQSSLGMSSGIIDVNKAFIGSQESGDQTNQDSCTATLTVTNAGVFRVNGTLALGYTTADLGDPSVPASTKGVVNIGPGGTVMASNVYVGGTTKASTGNAINLNGNATLIVSNGIADATPNGALGTMTFAGGNNTVKLFVDGLNTSSLIYVTNFTSSGTGNKLVIGGVKNITFPADIVVMTGAGTPAVSASSFDAGVVMPSGSGLSGTLATLNTGGSNAIVLHIINRVGNHLVWRASGSTADWDYTTPNWVNQTNGAPITYDNPDTVAFDDAAGVATNINIAGALTLTPAAINMTNTTHYYTFLNGPNSIGGGPSLNKFGTGTVEIDGNTTLSVQLNQGVLAGFNPGTIGNANIAAGAVMNYGGDMGGSLASAGTATTGGAIAGTLTVQSGGIVTNAGTANNPVTVLNGGFLYNSGTLNNIGTGTSGSPTVSSNATLINAGAINGDILFVNGTLEDLGGSANTTVTSVSLGANGNYIPGGDGIGVSQINSDGVGTFPGALLLSQGSFVTFKVNMALSPSNSLAQVSHLSYGASASQQTQNGCTLVITNVGAIPFNTNQTFQIFNNVNGSGGPPFSTGTSTNTFPVILPASPGPGLTWDLTQLWISGTIGIVRANSGPTFTSSIGVVNGTNIVAQFSWDSALLGYRLETQNNPLSVGLSTNWSGVAGSTTNTTVFITNSVSTNAVFYRLVFP